MDINKVDMFLFGMANKFPGAKMGIIREKLLTMDEDRFPIVHSIDYKDPTVILIISIFLGYLGIDRFMLGEIGLGLGKLLTGGGCGIWAIVDWFLITDAVKEYNFNAIMSIY